jgi:hypothetical protein
MAGTWAAQRHLLAVESVGEAGAEMVSRHAHQSASSDSGIVRLLDLLSLDGKSIHADRDGPTSRDKLAEYWPPWRSAVGGVIGSASYSG